MLSPAASAIPSVTAATTAATAAATTTTARRSIFAGAGDVDRQLSPLELFVMKHLHGFVRLVHVGHFDKRKSARFASELIHHHTGGADDSGAGKVFLEITVHSLVGKISNEQTRLIHSGYEVERSKQLGGESL